MFAETKCIHFASHLAIQLVINGCYSSFSELELVEVSITLPEDYLLTEERNRCCNSVVQLLPKRKIPRQRVLAL